MSNKYVCCACIAVMANISMANNRIYYFFITLIFISLLIVLIITRLTTKKIVILFCIIWFVFSLLRAYTDYQNRSYLPFQIVDQQIDATGVIYNQPERDGDRVQFKLKLKHMKFEQKEVDTREYVLVNVYLSEEKQIKETELWSRGHTIAIQAIAKQPQRAQNYKQFDYHDYLEKNMIHWIFQANDTSQIQIMSEKRTALYSVLYFFDQLKMKLYEPFNILFDEKEAGYLGGLVFGMKTNLNEELFTSFSQLGLTHILAVSGTHVAVVVACLLYTLKLFRVPQDKAYSITIIFLPIYILLTGAEPSIIRAGIMGMMGLWLIKKQKLKNTASILAVTALLMLAVNPLVIYNIGFQLSFIVTFGLIVFTPVIRKGFSNKKNHFLDLLSVTLSAQLTSFPLTLYYFNTFNPLSIVANLILVPYISFIILPLATITNLLSHLSLSLAKPIAFLTSLGNQVSFFIINKLNQLLEFNLIWRSPSFIWIVLWYCVSFALLSFIAQMKHIQFTIKQRSNHQFSLKLYRYSIIGLSISLVLLLVYAYEPHILVHKSEGTVSFISVGQGDSILIESPTRKHILVDSGGQVPFKKKADWALRDNPFDVGTSILLPILKKRGIHHLDIVVITHFDVDHFQGLISLMDEIKINEIWLNGTLKSDEETDKLYSKIKQYQIPIKKITQGDIIRIDKFTQLDVLWPNNFKLMTDKQNEHSIVLLLRMHQATFLLTGDIGEQTEREIVYWMNKQFGEIEQLDVFKLAHHGSKYSTSLSALSYFNPKIAVVSAGKDNRYGHPHKDVIKRLKLYNIPILRTDEDGEIVFVIKKNSLNLLKWNNS